GASGNTRLPLSSCHPDFANATFAGKDVLLNNDEWASAHPNEVREAFTSCLVSAAEYTRQKAAAPGARGFVTGMMGSSYSGPHAAGMVAAMREKYPQLSEYDLDAAALMASVPVHQVQRADGHLDHVAYAYNGRGLLHNSYEAGFGFLDENAYDAMVDKMAALLEARPQLATREATADATAHYQAGVGSASAGKTEYRLDMARDIVALRSNIALRFAGGPAGVPAKIELVDPAGGSVYLSPTKLPDNNMVYSLASTDGHFGVHTKGTWTIRIPAGYRLEEARLTVAGVAKGGLIDRTLDNLGHPVKPAPAVQTLKIASALTP
ncbi:MAG TPA: S8 family serine peptidase, partial [Patescibacteria group bacterium]|nr:S8 family serine peptidase [Patescibacteria group bacterium]